MLIAVIAGISEDCLGKALGIGLLVFVGLVLLILLARKIGKVNLKKQAQFVSVQEVIFHCNVIERYGKQVSTEMKVYEWSNNGFNLVNYSGVTINGKMEYGCILNKFTNQKGQTIFLKK